MSFLTAKWENLIMANYVINSEILKPHIPSGTQLDFFEGNCYISLVGFMFKNTKVLGIKMPYHINFEKVNLRFYVKRNDKRGVVFIKEIVPKPLITFIANSLYNEHYQTCKMKHDEDNTNNHYSYHWKIKEKWQSLSVKTKQNTIPIIENSEAEFIAEHYYGYTKGKHKTFEYEVKHPKWKQKEIINYDINVNFAANYGSEFRMLNQLMPKSVFLATGSDISVENKRIINPIYT
ncbi:DUF2071 domain-containing protein [Pontimicrobium sp. SW4]|uniref:DUF2071 domain-containing protein n=1 Tax=Pontimicrobium sp. SW4 TaxID=3153519 RepID=A0AAU7BQU7_9FLAO